MEYRTVGEWTIQESGELTHRNCDKGVRLLGRRMVCNQCLAVVPKSIRTLADEVSHLSGEVNMTIQEPVVADVLEVAPLEPTTVELEEELTEVIEELDEEIEAEAEAQGEDIENLFGDEQLGSPIEVEPHTTPAGSINVSKYL